MPNRFIPCLQSSTSAEDACLPSANVEDACPLSASVEDACPDACPLSANVEDACPLIVSPRTAVAQPKLTPHDHVFCDNGSTKRFSTKKGKFMDR
jgi:hypothetical protein